MIQLKHSPSLLATPDAIQIHIGGTLWNSNEDKQDQSSPITLRSKTQSLLSLLAAGYFTVTCLMQMSKVMFIHDDSYRPPFIP